MNQRTREVLRAVLLGLNLGLLAVVIGLAAVLVVIPKATGAVPLSVLTASMEPTLPPGTLVVVRPVDTDEVHIGDVVTYQIASGRPEVITHRVVAVATAPTGGRTFTFRGDANAVSDTGQVLPAQIRGKVWYSLPGVGYVNQVVNGNRTWVVPVIAGSLLAYGGTMIALGVVESVRRRRRRRPAVTALGRRRTNSPVLGRRRVLSSPHGRRRAAVPARPRRPSRPSQIE